jgi:hypothetical protein
MFPWPHLGIAMLVLSLVPGSDGEGPAEVETCGGTGLVGGGAVTSTR